MLEKRPMVREALTFESAGDFCGRAFRMLAATAVCLALAAAPAHAQFDFFDKLFGHGGEAKPPPKASGPAEAPAAKSKRSKAKRDKTKKSATANASPAAPAAEPPRPYDSQLLRLAEILGALSYFDGLCASAPVGDWRAKMQSLLEADANTAARKERLTGSFNRGFHDYERSYHFCTPNAQAVISRFLAEGAGIAHEVVNRYGAS